MLLLPSILTLVPHGAAPLAGFAGLCAAGLLAANPSSGFYAALRTPAMILAALILAGALSATWSIDPGRSLMLDARLAGLFAAGLALAAAAGRIAAPRRLTLCLIGGTAIAVVLAASDMASGGGLSQYVSARAFGAPRLNQIAVWLAVLLLPVCAILVTRRRFVLGLAVGLVAAVTVYAFEGTAAKAALTLSLPVAALFWLWRRTMARLAAVVSIAAILTAPLTLPRIVYIGGIFASADSFKSSAGHRLLIWSFAGDRIAERPFLGWGLDASRAIPGGKDEIRPGQTWLPLHPHDAALQVWLELGAPGAALFAMLVGLLWWRLAEPTWPRLYAAAAAGSLAAALAIVFSAWGIWQEWWLGTLDLALFAVLVMARTANPIVTPPPDDDPAQAASATPVSAPPPSRRGGGAA
ncbi:MAG TPA: O-antigen ligase family protein [Stellaceae bacterium]|jgi:O-antigen ligase|nr:O-antigen ligase family protein [Stellaceae bacterium]